MRRSASVLAISPFSAIATAIRIAARAVRLPSRVCSSHSLPASTVNSMSCISRKWFSSRLATSLQLLEGHRHGVFHRNEVAVVGLRLGQRMRRAQAGDHVLALGIGKVFAVETVFTGRRIAGKGHAGRRSLAHIAEDHRLHGDGGAPALRDAVQAAEGDGARIHPALHDRLDGAPELLAGILREFLVEFVEDRNLVSRRSRHASGRRSDRHREWRRFLLHPVDDLLERG
jgi:hypothetical protein